MKNLDFSLKLYKEMSCDEDLLLVIFARPLLAAHPCSIPCPPGQHNRTLSAAQDPAQWTLDSWERPRTPRPRKTGDSLFLQPLQSLFGFDGELCAAHSAGQRLQHLARRRGANLLKDRHTPQALQFLGTRSRVGERL